jgi:hypothetical protein
MQAGCGRHALEGDGAAANWLTSAMCAKGGTADGQGLPPFCLRPGVAGLYEHPILKEVRQCQHLRKWRAWLYCARR